MEEKSIFKINLTDDYHTNTCKICECENKAEYTLALSDGYNNSYLHYYCKKHLKELKKQFDSEYQKIEEYENFLKKQDTEKEELKEKLFN